MNREQGVVTVLLWSKNFIGKEKICGAFSIPLKDLPHLNAEEEPPAPEWYPVVQPQLKVLAAGGDVVITSQKPGQDELPDDDDDDESGDETPDISDRKSKKAEKKKKPKKKKAQPGDVVGHIRLQMFVRMPAVEKVVLPGIMLNGEWCDRMNGGIIVGNPFWSENPQYLLTVGCNTRVIISLAQPKDHSTQATFYVLRYNDSKYAGRRIPFFAKEDIVPIDRTEFLAPTFSTHGLFFRCFLFFLCLVFHVLYETNQTVEQDYNLEAGVYCIIPCISVKAIEFVSLFFFHDKGTILFMICVFSFLFKTQ